MRCLPGSLIIQRMLWRAEIIVEQDVDPRIEPLFSDEIEVSLDCAHCCRTGRTVIFERSKSSARCTPGSAAREGELHPPFPGRITDVRVERGPSGFTGTYALEYEVARFVDAKYGEAQPWARWTGYPTWARVSWRFTCPCGREQAISTQNNLGRPFEKRCACGLLVHHERRELPVLRYLDPAHGRWAEVPQRWAARA